MEETLRCVCHGWALAQLCMSIAATLLRGAQQWHTQLLFLIVEGELNGHAGLFREEASQWGSVGAALVLKAEFPRSASATSALLPVSGWARRRMCDCLYVALPQKPKCRGPRIGAQSPCLPAVFT